MSSVSDPAPVTPQPKRGRWYQYRLRTLLILFTLVCFGLGWLGWKYQRVRLRRDAVAAIHAVGGTVGYEHQYYENGQWKKGGELSVPELLYSGDLFVSVVSARIAKFNESIDKPTPLGRIYRDGRDVTAETLAHLASLPDLRTLELDSVELTDAELQIIGLCARLESLGIVVSEITEECVAQLARLDRLTGLAILASEISDESLKRLARLERLESQRLTVGGISTHGHVSPTGRGWPGQPGFVPHGPPISAAALQGIAELPKLKHLLLSIPNLGDDAIAPLEGMIQLDELIIHSPIQIREAQSRLKEALPRTNITVQGDMTGGGFVIPDVPFRWRPPNARP